HSSYTSSPHHYPLSPISFYTGSSPTRSSLHAIRHVPPNNCFPDRKIRTIRITDFAVGNPRLLVAFPSLSSCLLLDAADIDLPDKSLRDKVEGVNLLLHLNIANLQW